MSETYQRDELRSARLRRGIVEQDIRKDEPDDLWDDQAFRFVLETKARTAKLRARTIDLLAKAETRPSSCCCCGGPLHSSNDPPESAALASGVSAQDEVRLDTTVKLEPATGSKSASTRSPRFRGSRKPPVDTGLRRPSPGTKNRKRLSREATLESESKRKPATRGATGESEPKNPKPSNTKATADPEQKESADGLQPSPPVEIKVVNADKRKLNKVRRNSSNFSSQCSVKSHSSLSDRPSFDNDLADASQKEGQPESPEKNKKPSTFASRPKLAVSKARATRRGGTRRSMSRQSFVTNVDVGEEVYNEGRQLDGNYVVLSIAEDVDSESLNIEAFTPATKHKDKRSMNFEEAALLFAWGDVEDLSKEERYKWLGDNLDIIIGEDGARHLGVPGYKTVEKDGLCAATLGFKDVFKDFKRKSVLIAPPPPDQFAPPSDSND